MRVARRYIAFLTSLSCTAACDHPRASPVDSAALKASAVDTSAAVRFQGRTVAEWFAIATDLDRGYASQGRAALTSIGEPAAPYLVGQLTRVGTRESAMAAVILGSMCPNVLPHLLAANPRVKPGELPYAQLSDRSEACQRAIVHLMIPPTVP
jgi:hypothetical protein